MDYGRTTSELFMLSFWPALRRHKKLLVLGLLVAAVGAFGFHYFVGPRYEAYVLLRVGQGVKDRSTEGTSNPFDGVDLVARIDSVARIATTDYVIREAANQVGLNRFEVRQKPTFISDAFAWLAGWFEYIEANLAPAKTSDSETPSETRVPDPAAVLVSELREKLTWRQEGRSDILRISYRSTNPTLAADFVNNLGNILVANYADVTQVLGADSFFQQQTKQLEDEAEQAAIELRNFSISASIYSVAEQRGLLLKRLNDLAAQLTANRGSIVEKKGFKTALMDELMLLRPVYQSKQVSNLVKTLGGPDYQPDKSVVDGNRVDFGETPPILLVKIYQDNMANLMKVNADLAGYAHLEKSLGAEITSVNTELAALTAKEAEYDRLRRTLTRASAAAENYGSRTIEEKMKADIAKRAQLSSVRVVQTAEVPFNTVFPNALQLVLLTILFGLGSGAAIAVMLEIAALRKADENKNIEDGRVIRYYRRDEMAKPAE